MNNLRRLDLNLLVTLDVLLAEHNVTRAAEKLNMSQPSVSVQLQKLRDVFGDPLLGDEGFDRIGEPEQLVHMVLENHPHGSGPRAGA